MAFFKNRATAQAGSAASAADTQPLAASEPVAPAVVLTHDDLRRRARQRLIGSAVLVALAVLVLPWVLDAPPRPLPAQIPLEIVGKPDAASAPVAKTAAASAAGRSAVALDTSLADDEEIVPSAAGAASQTVATASSAPRPGAGVALAGSAAAATALIVPARPQPDAAAQARADAATRQKDQAQRNELARRAAQDRAAQQTLKQEKAAHDQAEKERAAKERADQERAAREKREKAAHDKAAQDKAAREKAAREKAERAEKAAAARKAAEAAAAKGNAVQYDFPETGRFVVQVGKSVDKDKVAGVRQKLARAGISNYTQVVKQDGKDVTRVRIGPFKTRKEMERTAARLRALGLPVSLYSY